MTELVSIKPGEWVVVCDGAKALIMENTGDATFPNLKVRDTIEHKAAKTADLGTDAPGRTHNSVGQARSSVEQTDWHEQEEREFLHGLVRLLETAVQDGAAKSVVMVAPPRALGVVRAAYGPALKGAVRAEVAKDLVKLPVGDIEKHLVA